MILLYQIKRDKRDKFRPGKKIFGKSENLIGAFFDFQTKIIIRFPEHNHL